MPSDDTGVLIVRGEILPYSNQSRLSQRGRATARTVLRACGLPTNTDPLGAFIPTDTLRAGHYQQIDFF